MNGSGLFFLTGRPSLVELISPDPGPRRVGWQFSTLERTQRGVQRLVAIWEGDTAAAFVTTHTAALKKGCALQLELQRVRPASNRDGLCASIVACAIAPARWPSLDVRRVPAPAITLRPVTA